MRSSRSGSSEALQDHTDLLARFPFLELQRPVEVGGIELAALDEDFTEAFGQWSSFRT
jgi:hypothetical protein